MNEMRLNVKNLCSRWRRKITDFVSQADSNCILSGKDELMLVKVRPPFDGEVDVTPKNRLSSSIIQGHTICDGMKAAGRCRLYGSSRAMDHEGCACASLSFLGTEISDGGSR